MSEGHEKTCQRVGSVDLLRGLVMVIMLLDHTREYVHADAFRFSPTDLTKTNVLLFFTRWVTHLCAPTFVLLAGTSVYLQRLRGNSRGALSLFLLTRGFWLIALEFTIVRFAMLFNVDYTFLGLAEVIWAIGVSMIVLAALIFLPVRACALIGITVVAFHDLFDGIVVPPATAMAGTPAPGALEKLWLFFHQPGFVPVFQDVKLFVAYPLVPWVGGDGGRLRARRNLRMGGRATARITLPTRTRLARPLRLDTGHKYLWRPAALVGPSDTRLHDFVLPQYDKIPGLLPLLADDARCGLVDSGFD